MIQIKPVHPLLEMAAHRKGLSFQVAGPVLLQIQVINLVAHVDWSRAVLAAAHPLPKDSTILDQSPGSHHSLEMLQEGLPVMTLLTEALSSSRSVVRGGSKEERDQLIRSFAAVLKNLIFFAIPSTISWAFYTNLFSVHIPFYLLGWDLLNRQNFIYSSPETLGNSQLVMVRCLRAVQLAIYCHCLFLRIDIGRGYSHFEAAQALLCCRLKTSMCVFQQDNCLYETYSKKKKKKTVHVPSLKANISKSLVEKLVQVIGFVSLLMPNNLEACLCLMQFLA